jgi:hypothetical protein
MKRLVETVAVDDDDDDAATVAVIAAAHHAAAPAVTPSYCPSGSLCCTTAHCSVAVALLRIWMKTLPAAAGSAL